MLFHDHIHTTAAWTLDSLQEQHSLSQLPVERENGSSSGSQIKIQEPYYTTQSAFRHSRNRAKDKMMGEWE